MRRRMNGAEICIVVCSVPYFSPEPYSIFYPAPATITGGKFRPFLITVTSHWYGQLPRDSRLRRQLGLYLFWRPRIADTDRRLRCPAFYRHLRRRAGTCKLPFTLLILIKSPEGFLNVLSTSQGYRTREYQKPCLGIPSRLAGQQVICTRSPQFPMSQPGFLIALPPLGTRGFLFGYPRSGKYNSVRQSRVRPAVRARNLRAYYWPLQ